MRDPAWLPELRANSALTTDLELTWLDPDARDAIHAGARDEISSDVPNFGARGLEGLERSIVLALGPERATTISGIRSAAALFFDPATPDRVWLSFAPSMNPLT